MKTGKEVVDNWYKETLGFNTIPINDLPSAIDNALKEAFLEGEIAALTIAIKNAKAIKKGQDK